MTECINCDKAPICHTQLTLNIAKLKDILIEVDRFNVVVAREKILSMINTMEKSNLEVTGR